ncbi:response regulator [Lacinutrix sp. Bg11-31]|uniref:response regulator n=1 Tax=Lacinutrix sp. Bg11-31 TaxID=2057808 RepID=UPI000C3078EC|nr:response regulator [Lacinutrix sp. Bg11-31]AUC81471.1 response regulator [Lacinutrix sp. Bg11-31]
MKKNLPLIGIIDDDKIYQFTLTRIINKHKFAREILSFLDGELALDFLSDNISTLGNIPDLIFLDSNMPIMDGWQFIEEYAILETQIKKKIKIFMVSSSVDPIDIERANKINQISDYIIKPITLDEVKRVIDTL